MVRRMLNTSKGAPKEILEEITDRYAEKLQKSGNKLEQIRKIILSGIRDLIARRRCARKKGET